MSNEVAAYITVNCPRCRAEVMLPIFVHTVRYDDAMIKTGAVFAGVNVGSARHTCKSEDE